jgi:hypothetical protein
MRRPILAWLIAFATLALVIRRRPLRLAHGGRLAACQTGDHVCFFQGVGHGRAARWTTLGVCANCAPVSAILERLQAGSSGRDNGGFVNAETR